MQSLVDERLNKAMQLCIDLREPKLNYREMETLRKLIYKEERENTDHKYRFEEIDVNWVWKVDIVCMILQFLTAIFWVGNWFSLLFVNFPRVLMGTMTQKNYFKRYCINNHQIKRYYKAERIFRIVSLIVALMLEIGCATLLSQQFCDFWGVEDDSATSHRVSMSVACKW